jgi:hypothetical protein
MPHKPITTFAAAIAFGILASAAIAAPGQQETAAANAAPECHAAPKGVAPQGAHWNYRTDRAAKKKCWYLADLVAKPKKATATPPTQSSDADDAAPRPEPTADKSIADARAEIPASRKPAKSQPVENLATEDQSLAESVWPALPDKSESETTTAIAAPAAASEVNGFASRWPDQANAAPSPDAQALLARKQADQQQAALQPQPTAASTTVGRANAATPTDPVEPTGSSVGTLGLVLSVLAGLLALAAIVGPAIFKRTRRKQPKTERRNIWDSVDSDNPPAPWDAEQDVRNDNQPHGLRDLDAENDKLQQILQRAAKRSAA